MRKNPTKHRKQTEKVNFAWVFDAPDFVAKCYGAKLLGRRNGLEVSRLGVTLVKKYGNAVQRNYGRRVIKEIFRKRQQSISAGFDLVVVLFPGKCDYHEREHQFTTLVEKSGIDDVAV